MEKAMLLKVEKTGEILKLIDGRRLRVNPWDMPNACTWLPTTELEISEGGSGLFSVSVHNIADDVVIRGMWI